MKSRYLLFLGIILSTPTWSSYLGRPPTAQERAEFAGDIEDAVPCRMAPPRGGRPGVVLWAASESSGQIRSQGCSQACSAAESLVPPPPALARAQAASPFDREESSPDVDGWLKPLFPSRGAHSLAEFLARPPRIKRARAGGVPDFGEASPRRRGRSAILSSSLGFDPAAEGVTVGGVDGVLHHVRFTVPCLPREEGEIIDPALSREDDARFASWWWRHRGESGDEWSENDSGYGCVSDAETPEADHPAAEAMGEGGFYGALDDLTQEKFTSSQWGWVCRHPADSSFHMMNIEELLQIARSLRISVRRDVCFESVPKWVKRLDDATKANVGFMALQGDFDGVLSLIREHVQAKTRKKVSAWMNFGFRNAFASIVGRSRGGRDIDAFLCASARDATVASENRFLPIVEAEVRRHIEWELRRMIAKDNLHLLWRIPVEYWHWFKHLSENGDYDEEDDAA